MNYSLPARAHVEVVLAAAVAAAVIFYTAGVHAWVVPWTTHATKNNKTSIVFYWFSESRLPKVSVSRRRNVHSGKDVLLGVLRRRQGQSRKKTHSKVACVFCVGVVIF